MQAKPFNLRVTVRIAAVVVVIVAGSLVIWWWNASSVTSVSSPPEKLHGSGENVVTENKILIEPEVQEDSQKSSESMKAAALRSIEEWEKRGFIVDYRTTVETDLHNLRRQLKDYRVTFGDYPSGDSDAIMKALSGDNSKKMKFIDPESKLLDPWRTAYLFSRDNAHGLEIRSAGADRVFWTQDDVTLPLEGH